MKKLLIIVPFEKIYPPTNGGMQRCFHIIHQLCKNYEVTLITHQDAVSLMEAGKKYPAFANCTIISTSGRPDSLDIFSLVPAKYQKALRFRAWKRTLKGPADDNFLRYYQQLKNLLSKKNFDYAVLETLSALHAASVIHRMVPGCKIVFDAHNADTHLAQAFLKKGLMPQKHVDMICQMEATLYKTVDAVIACSDIDRQFFKEANGDNLQVETIPNGVTVRRSEKKAGNQTSFNILFCGSLDYSPNVEGLLWFYRKVWPLIKGLQKLKFVVIGSGQPDGQLKELQEDKEVCFEGFVDDIDPFYAQASMVIVPILSGSGTRLKVLEAMSMGVPVLSTAKGAEGIRYANGKNILIADSPEQFAESIGSLYNNQQWGMEIGKEAVELIRSSYDWDLIGKNLSQFLNTIDK